MSSAVPWLPLPPNKIYPYSNPNRCRLLRFTARNSQPYHLGRGHSSKVSASSGGERNLTPYSSSGDFFRHIAVSSILLLGLGLSHGACAAPLHIPSLAPSASAIHNVSDASDIETEEMEAAFERWKSKTYALTVPLRIVALRNSLPPVWFRDFMKSQGKRLRFRPEFRPSLHDIFSELSIRYSRGTLNPKSALAADIVTLGDSWLSSAIKEGLIEPIRGVEDLDWFRNLTDKWKVYLRRSRSGKLDSHGEIWAAPYRWGSIAIAYKKNKFQKHKLAPIEDWADLWRPELAGKISMVDSPREIVGAVLKSMGASYNTFNINSEVAGGKSALQEKLALLAKQVRLFDSQHYLKALSVGDVWVAVGWSSDVLPAAKRMSNIAVIVPKSGASLWADFWAIPATSRLESDKFGGRVRGPSPLVHQWIEFCLQPKRAVSFKEEATAGASPIALEYPVQQSENLNKGGAPKLDTNLIAGIPPPEILVRCEFLEPLPEEALSDYLQLINSIKKPNHSVMQRLQHYILSVLQVVLPKVQSKVA